MKETSKFTKIGHLNKNKVFEWLKLEDFDIKEIELVWEYYGGNISRLLEAIKVKKKGANLEEFLKQEAWITYTEIVDFLTDFDENEREYFKEVAGEIVEKELKVTGNSRIYEKGFEILLERS